MKPRSPIVFKPKVRFNIPSAEIPCTTIEITKAPIAVLVKSLISPAPVNFAEAIGENKTKDQATDKRKKSAMIFMEAAVAIISL